MKVIDFLIRLGAWCFAPLVLLGLGAVFWYAPKDAAMGQVQRIMYLHVPCAWSAFLAFFVVFAASIVYLLRRDEEWDYVALAAAEVGVYLTTLAIITGSIWGKPTWGVWWTWDARLTTTAVLLAIYLGYLLLRSFLEDRRQGARYAAVVGILGFLDVPLIYLSVEWWRTLHQPASVLRSGGPSMAPEMLATLLLNVAAFTALFFYLLGRRRELERLRRSSELFIEAREGAGGSVDA